MLQVFLIIRIYALIMKNILGPMLSHKIMESQTVKGSITPKQRKALFLNGQKKGAKKHVTVKEGFARTQDNVKIHFWSFKYKNKAVEPGAQKLIIHAVGSGHECHHYVSNFIQEARKYPKTTIVAFDCRNVGASDPVQPQCEADWVNDALAVIMHFKKKGFKNENILLEGHSLGGAILTLAGARLFQMEKAKARAQKKDPNQIKSVKLINNRSFSSLTPVVISILTEKGIPIACALMYGLSIALFTGVAWWSLKVGSLVAAVLCPLLWLVGTLCPTLPKRLLSPLVGGLLWLGFGTMNASKAYRQFPENSREYLTAKDDTNIYNWCSLHHSLKDFNTQKKKELKEAGSAQAKQQLRTLKDRVLHKSPKIKGYLNTHLSPLKNLSTTHTLRAQKKGDSAVHQISGQQVMDNQIKRLLNIRS